MSRHPEKYYIYKDVCALQLPTTIVATISSLKLCAQKLVMTIILIDMGLAGPALQLWKKSGS
jgi:hypothetical protein